MSYDEINISVQELKLNKSPGEDTTPNKILKLKPVVCILYKLFHFCFANSIAPTTWLKCVITPSTFKDPCMSLNYRGITLLSCMSKVYTKVLNKRIISYVEEGNVFVEEQSEFRAQRSCLDNLFRLTSIIRNENSAGKHVYAAFLEMQKAFDWVDRDFLKYKLLSIGINGQIYNAIDQLYRETVSCAKFNQFEPAHRWCYKWKMQINHEKSNIVHFQRKRVNRSSHKFKFRSIELSIVNSYKKIRIFIR